MRSDHEKTLLLRCPSWMPVITLHGGHTHILFYSALPFYDAPVLLLVLHLRTHQKWNAILRHFGIGFS